MPSAGEEMSNQERGHVTCVFTKLSQMTAQRKLSFISCILTTALTYQRIFLYTISSDLHNGFAQHVNEML